MTEVVSDQLGALPLLPLRGLVLFPHAIAPLEVGRERSILAIEQALLHEGRIVLATQRDPRQDVPKADDIYEVGVLAVVKQSLKLPGGQIKALVEGIKRVRIEAVLASDPHFSVTFSDVEETADPADSELMRGLVQAALRQFEKYIAVSKKIPSEVLVGLNGIDDPNRLADMIAAHLQVKLEQRQRLLELANPAKRLEHICELLAEELEILEIERRIHTRVRRQMEKTQREYYLREQVKAIQKELGEADERASEINEYKKRIKAAKLPKQAKEKVEHELSRLERMPSAAAESVIVRTYLDWMLSLPWSKTSKDLVDIAKAEQILDEDHFGLDKVKERILEFLAVRQLADKIKGPILCLVGPPGVGKTSLAKSVARSLDRQFVRFSLGGVRDEAEIRGHRRTYVGAMPGKLIQALRQAGTKNPVILLDEVDKMSMDFRGDPSAALLEVLDPEQNHTFADHYLEVPFDLSDVFFITTANVLPQIPGPLRDRMEVIQISGYTEDEKVGIAREHVLPKQIEAHGLNDAHLAVSENAIREIVRSHTREAGVRQLERSMATICRKVALEVVQGSKATSQVTARSIEKYLGTPRYRYNQAEEEDRIGLATGLAYTQVGGDILSIEVTVVKGKGNLTLTGKLGDVMRESAQAAYSYIRSRYAQLGLDATFYEQCDIHLHVPEGAIPKDGPSAGIAIGVALASAFTGRYVSREVAMTGEITLRGRILPIGGVKEKVLAAHRSGIKCVILPTENERDLDEIPPQVKRSMEFVLVSHMDEALSRALLSPALTAQRQTAAADDTASYIPHEGDGVGPWVEETAQ